MRLKEILNIFNGFCMALADSVPGVSGGTIAFILGFYEQLLESINNITSKKKEKIKESILFLAKLLFGWIIGLVFSVAFLTKMFNENLYLMTSLFFGLTLSSIIYIVKTEMKVNVKKIGYTILGILLVTVISSFRTKLIHTDIHSLANLNLVEYIYVFISGMIAISAMVLPGISGSTLLLILGIYIPVIEAIGDILKFNFSVLGGIFVLLLGICTGFVTSVRIIRRAFKKNRESMMHFVIGLTIGSLYSISIGPTTMSKANEVLNMDNFSIFGFSIGVLILILLEIFRKIASNSR